VGSPVAYRCGIPARRDGCRGRRAGGPGPPGGTAGLAAGAVASAARPRRPGTPHRPVPGGREPGARAREIASRTQDSTLYGLFYAFIPEVLRRTGRFGGYEPELTQVAEAVPVLIALGISGHFQLAAGDTGQAATLYERLRPRLATLPLDSRWLAVVTAGAELAAQFGDQETTALCYRLLPTMSPRRPRTAGLSRSRSASPLRSTRLPPPAAAASRSRASSAS
jgi:hypothetical protein